MSERPEVLQDLIEPVRAGFWGTAERVSSQQKPCRVVRNGDVAKNGYIPRSQLPVRWFTPDEIEKARVQEGDVVLVSSGAYTGNSGVVAEPDDGLPVIASNFVRRLRPKSTFNSAWFFHLVRSYIVQKYVPAHTGGSAIPNLSSTLYRKCPVPFVPGKKIQFRIAEILLTLDETIEQTEALIAKHPQIKAGLMHALFTRGVTPDGRLRPTRAQAPHLYKESPLGLIPKEWEASPAETLLARIIDYRGRTPTKTVDGIPLVTAKNVRMGYIAPEPREFIAESDYVFWMTRGIPNEGDVLFTTEAPLGNIAQIETTDRVAFAQRVIILQLGPKVRSSFLKFVLMSDRTQRAIARLASGTTALGIKQSEFRKVLLSYPLGPKEQELIEEKLEAVDGYLHEQQKVMGKLHQQKHGLMHDLLTGRVRVKVAEWGGGADASGGSDGAG